MTDEKPAENPMEGAAKMVQYTPSAMDVGDPLYDVGLFNHMWRVAKTFSASRLVPEHLRGKDADVFIALALAKRASLDPLVVLQSIYFVGGKAGWSAAYLIARAKQAGMLIRWDIEEQPGKVDFKGKAMVNLKVTARAKLPDGEVVSTTITSQDAADEGWPSNPKYFTSCALMLQYRTATRLVRLYAPDILLGLPVAEELDVIEVDAAPADVAKAKAALNRSTTPTRQIGEQPRDLAQEAADLRRDQEPAHMDHEPELADPSAEDDAP